MKNNFLGCFLTYILSSYVLNFFFIKLVYHPCFPHESKASLGFSLIVSPISFPFEILAVLSNQFGNIVTYIGGLLT